MSKVIWQKVMTPDMSTPATVLKNDVYQDIVENVRFYPVASEAIAIPDPKAFRSMSRTAVFLSHMLMEAGEALKKHQTKGPFDIGIYCAVENGPIDAPSTQKILDQMATAPEKFAEFYRKNRNPKMYLKQLPNLIPAQMGISFNLQGPMNVYTHSTQGAIQALEQAEWDLQQGTVECALVCAAHAFDDFMVVKRERFSDMRTLCEGAGAMLLEKSSQMTNWEQLVTTDPQNWFGIADQVVRVLSSGKPA